MFREMVETNQAKKIECEPEMRTALAVYWGSERDEKEEFCTKLGRYRTVILHTGRHKI
jgi:hypothetical protein